jgi:hypothetical protein
LSSQIKIHSFEKLLWPARAEFWQQQGFLIESVLALEPAEDFLNEWPSLQKSASCVLIGEDQCSEVLGQFQSLPSDIKLSHSFDCILKIQGKWWVRDFWALALKESLVKRVSRLDTHSVAYLTGSQGHARASLAVLSELGFKKINWVTDEPDKLAPDRNRFLKNFFGVELRLIPSQELILQPNNGTVLINTIAATEDSELLQNLIYLNFLQKGGAAVDTHTFPLENQLLDEAESVDIHSVPGWYLEATRDHLLLPHLTSKPVPELDVYAKDWLQFLKTRPTSSHK